MRSRASYLPCVDKTNKLMKFSSAADAVDITAQFRRLEAKLDEALFQLDFITSHLSSYIGSQTALTYLADGTPIYVNSNDFGPPANFVAGGLYEVDNLETLFSFVHCDSVFLDIGANLGFFSLNLARRLPFGRVHAFEPHPQLARLARASAYLNGFSQLHGTADARIVVHQLGLGEQNGEVTFSYPQDHLGGGTQGAGSGQQIKAELHRLDDLMPDSLICDIVKIDVEGHELGVLRGMRGTLARSPNAVVLFEKLERGAGNEAPLEAYFEKLGFHLFGIDPGPVLRPLQKDTLADYSGYVLAHRDPDLRRSRSFFRIYPRQFVTQAATLQRQERDLLEATGGDREILFYGPYWRLRRGVYRIKLGGEIDGDVALTVAARFGFPVATLSLSAAYKSAEFICERDLQYFEIVARAKGGPASVALNWVELERIG